MLPTQEDEQIAQDQKGKQQLAQRQVSKFWKEAHVGGGEVYSIKSN